MEPLAPGWRVLADALHARLDLLDKVYRYALGAFVILVLVAPLDNLLEIPHGVFLWSSGSDRPFSEWKVDYDQAAAIKSPQGRNEQGLDLRGLPPQTALPGIDFYWMLVFTGLFFASQYLFLPRRGFSLAVPVFGWFVGSLAGSAFLLFLEYADALQMLDTQFRLAARAGGSVGQFSYYFGGWQNRPWVYVVISVTAVIAAAAGWRLVRRDPVGGRMSMLVFLFAASSAETLAGFAVDLATRIRQPATFLTGTFVTLLIGGAMCIWSVGPLLEAWRLQPVPEAEKP